MNSEIISPQGEVTNIGHVPGLAQQAKDDNHLIEMWIAKRRSKNTQKTYRMSIDAFREQTDHKPLQTLTLDDLLKYQQHLDETYTNANTRKLKINVIKSLFTFGHTLGYFAFNLGAVIESPSAPNTLTERILTEADVFKVLDTPKRKQTRVIVHILYYSALRVSELVNLRWKDVQPNGEVLQLSVTDAKSDEGVRSVLLTPTVSSMVEEFRPEDVKPHDFVFTSQKDGSGLAADTVYRLVKNIGRKIGIDGLSPHWFRHSHISHAIDHGAPITVVRDTAGHSSIAITNRYAHAKPNDSSSYYLPK